MYYLPLLDTVDGDDGITVNEGTVIWILLVVLIVCLIVFVVNRIR